MTTITRPRRAAQYVTSLAVSLAAVVTVLAAILAPGHSARHVLADGGIDQPAAAVGLFSAAHSAQAQAAAN